MKEIIIDFDKEKSLRINQSIDIKVGLQEKENEKIKYKFIEGVNGIWNPIRDFSEDKICKWTPKESGKYMIMVQGKSTECKGPYDYLGKTEITINQDKDINYKEIVEEKKIIDNIIIDNNIVNVGEKITIDVHSKKEDILFRYWIKGKQDWEIINNYTSKNTCIYTCNEEGVKEFLIECKEIKSSKNVDDFKTLKIEVKGLDKVEITDFICLSQNMFVNEELLFKVEANFKEKRPILYKFLKVKSSGKLVCIQDYSSRSSVSLSESKAGEYKLLCLIRDMFSDKEYDDRAQISYSIKPYEKIKIENIRTDIASPQAIGNLINITSKVLGGREILYKYVIEGPIVEESGYLRSTHYVWEPRTEGKYTITLKVKDISFKGQWEDIKTIEYEIYKRSEKPVRIVEVTSDKGKKILVGQSIRVSTKVEGGNNNLYKYVVYKDGIESERVDYSKSNWINFTPESYGNYEVITMVKDIYSSKEYDSSASLYITVKDYIQAEIECLLVNSRENYLVNELIKIEPILINGSDVLLKYITKINGSEVENTEYGINRVLNIRPRCEGKYNITVLAKNKKSTEEYDSKKELTIYVHDVRNVTSTKVSILQNEIKIGETIDFKVESNGGKDVCYKFYIMNKNQWILVQNYSKKNYYSFIPFVKGEYRILVLSKSYHKNNEYEDYDTMTFEVGE